MLVKKYLLRKRLMLSIGVLRRIMTILHGNKLVGQATEPRTSLGFGFLSLPKKNGNYLPTSDGFVNYLSDDWDFFYFDNLNSENRTYNPKEGYLGINILFAKDFSGDYIFRGVYRIDFEKSGPNHLVHKRIATRIKLIGNPVQRYEMLDTVETTIIDDINTPLKPKDVIRKEDGITQYICGRCTTQFIKSPRCPECGQLVKE